MKQYRKFEEVNKRPAYFVQGFWFGVVFGTAGALIILGRNNK